MLVITYNPHAGAGPCDPRVQGTLRNMQLGREGSVFPGGLLFLALGVAAQADRGESD